MIQNVLKMTMKNLSYLKILFLNSDYALWCNTENKVMYKASGLFFYSTVMLYK